MPLPLNSPGLVGLALVFSLTPLEARASIIDFESLAELEVVTTQFPGLTFSNAVIYSAGSTINENELPPKSGLNVVVDEGGPIRINFRTPVVAFAGYFTYLVPLTLSAFDSTNGLLGSVSSAFSTNQGLSGDPGSSPNEFLQVAFANMAYVTIAADPGGTSFAADDLIVTPPASTAVPEPGAFGLVLLGAIALWVKRRRPVDNSVRRS